MSRKKKGKKKGGSPTEGEIVLGANGQVQVLAPQPITPPKQQNNAPPPRPAVRDRIFSALLDWDVGWLRGLEFQPGDAGYPPILRREKADSGPFAAPPPLVDRFAGTSEYRSRQVALFLCELWEEVKSEAASGTDALMERGAAILGPLVFSFPNLKSKERKVMAFKNKGSPFHVLKLTALVHLTFPREDKEELRFFFAKGLFKLHSIANPNQSSPSHTVFAFNPEGINLTQAEGKPATWFNLNLSLQLAGKWEGNHFLQPPFVFKLRRVAGLTSQTRMADALDALETSLLQPAILDPPRNVRRFLVATPAVEPDAVAALQDWFNPSQRDAVFAIAEAVAGRGSGKHPGLFLIHGPPGTGKSRTILGLLHRVLQLKQRKIVLLLAPSNAAVDELVRKYDRFLDNQFGSPEIVRMGRKDCVAPDVVHHQPGWERGVFLKRRLNAVAERLTEVRNRVTSGGLSAEELRELAKEVELGKGVMNQLQLHLAINSRIDDAPHPDARRQAWEELYKHVRVVAATLNSSGHYSLDSLVGKVRCVVVDEACQGSEMETLIPLRFGCPYLVLVGDPHQLPPTIASDVAANAGFARSLYERIEDSLQDADELQDARDQFKSLGAPMQGPVWFLDTQYRMHPSIAAWPSRYIYHSRLRTHESVEARESGGVGQPYFFFDLPGSDEEATGTSRANLEEVECVRQLVKELRVAWPQHGADIGVISFYKAQVDRIKAVVPPGVEVGTVDGFQGREKAIIILSCVRTDSIGFLGDRRRLNVALTRAQAALVVLGSLARLARLGRDWRSLVSDAVNRGTILSLPQVDNSALTAAVRLLSQSNETSTSTSTALTQTAVVQTAESPPRMADWSQIATELRPGSMAAAVVELGMEEELELEVEVDLELEVSVVEEKGSLASADPWEAALQEARSSTSQEAQSSSSLVEEKEEEGEWSWRAVVENLLGPSWRVEGGGGGADGRVGERAKTALAKWIESGARKVLGRCPPTSRSQLETSEIW